MSRVTLWNDGGAVIVGLALGLISPQLGKLPMCAPWFGVLLGWTTTSARLQPPAIRGWWSSIVVWLVALVTDAHMGQSLAWDGAWSRPHGARGRARCRPLAPHDPHPASVPNHQPIKACICHKKGGTKLKSERLLDTLP